MSVQRNAVMSFSLALATALIGTTARGATGVTENDAGLKIAGRTWRTVDAPVAYIAMVGVKLTRGRNGFAPRFAPELPMELEARRLTVVSSETVEKAARKALLEAGKSATDIDANWLSTTGSTRQANLHQFQILDIYKLIRALNAESNRESLEALISEGDGARVVVANVTVFDNHISETLSTRKGISISVTSPNTTHARVSLGSERDSSATTSYSDGTVFAYQYSRICWKRQGDRLVVGMLKEDLIGKSEPCPRGMNEDPSKVRTTL